MRLCSFLHAQRPAWGAVMTESDADADADAVIVADLSAATPWASLDAALAAGALAPEGRARLALAAARAPRPPPREIAWRLPLTSAATRYLCIGINYRDHASEMGRAPPGKPTVFMRFASSLVAQGEPVVAPLASSAFDYEGELAVVIGRAGRRIPRERALEHVAGYACFGDHSVRDYQRHSSQFTAGKNFDRSGAFGPVLVSADEVPVIGALRLETRLNGELRQSAPLSDLIFDVPDLIVYLSEVLELRPGDVIATGTPGGVAAARGPEFFMRPGDLIEVSIGGVGTLRNPVVAEVGGS